MDISNERYEIVKLLDKIIKQYNDNIENNNKSIYNDKEIIKNLKNQVNTHLEEINEKEKTISSLNKKCYDYECMINKYQEQKIAEEEEKLCNNKVSLVIQQANELQKKDNYIEVLEKRLKIYEKKSKNKINLDSGKDSPKDVIDINLSPKSEPESEKSTPGPAPEPAPESSPEPEPEPAPEPSPEPKKKTINITSKTILKCSLDFYLKHIDNYKTPEDLKNIYAHMIDHNYSFVNCSKNVKENCINEIIIKYFSVDESPLVQEATDSIFCKSSKVSSEEEEEPVYKKIKYKNVKYYVIDGENPQDVYSIDDNGIISDIVGTRKKLDNGKYKYKMH